MTVIASNSLYQVYNQLAADARAAAAAASPTRSATWARPNLHGFNESLIVFAGEHAEVLRQSGWSRREVQRFLIEHARRRVADSSAAARLPGRRSTPADETTWRYVFERPDDILIVCAGGRAGSWSACLPGWGNKWTRSVTTRIEIPGGDGMKLFDPTSKPVRARGQARAAAGELAGACGSGWSRTPSSTPSRILREAGRAAAPGATA